MAKSKVALGAAIAAVAGFVTGVLLAPKSGKETQKEVKEAANAAKDKAVSEYKAVRNTVEAKASKAKKAVEQKSKQVKAKATEIAEEAIEKAESLKNKAAKTPAKKSATSKK